LKSFRFLKTRFHGLAEPIENWKMARYEQPEDILKGIKYPPNEIAYTYTKGS
jgi:hypothetical protein